MKDKIYELLISRGNLNADELKQLLNVDCSIHSYIMDLEQEGKIKRVRCYTDKRIYTLSAITLKDD